MQAANLLSLAVTTTFHHCQQSLGWLGERVTGLTHAWVPGIRLDHRSTSPPSPSAGTRGVCKATSHAPPRPTALLRQNALERGWGNGTVLTVAQLCGQNDALVRKMTAFISPRKTAHAGPPTGCPEGGLGENKIVYFTGSLLETSQGRTATLDAAVLAHTAEGSRREGGAWGGGGR